MRDISYNDTPFTKEKVSSPERRGVRGRIRAADIGDPATSRPRCRDTERQRPGRTARHDLIPIGRYWSGLVSDQPSDRRRIGVHDRPAPDPAGWDGQAARRPGPTVLADGQTPPGARPGNYKGTLSIQAARGPKLAGSARIPGPRRNTRPRGYSRRAVWARDWHPLVSGRPQGCQVQSADGRAEPATDARLRLHGMHRLAIDFVSWVQPGQTCPGLYFG